MANKESKFKNDGSEWLCFIPEQGETSCYEEIAERADVPT